MSWPSNDFEFEVEQELKALREVAAKAKRVVEGRIHAESEQHFGKSEWKHSRVSDTIIDELAAALQKVPEEAT